MSEIKVLDKGFVRLVDSMGDDSSIVQAARVSYGKGTKKVNEDEGLIRYLMRHKHSTPFEMVQFKFHIKAPIFVFRQWHRHRMWSYNEYSGRYSEMKDEFYVPDISSITKQNPTNKQGGTNEAVDAPEIWQNEFVVEQSDDRVFYETLLKSGMRKELARINLPLAQYSEMYASVDLHNLFHFLKLRMDSHAQYEIRVYAEAIAEIVKEKVPLAYAAFEDYILGGLFLSKKDLDAVKFLLDVKRSNADITVAEGTQDAVIAKTAEMFFTNKREKEEFLSKLNKILVEENK